MKVIVVIASILIVCAAQACTATKTMQNESPAISTNVCSVLKAPRDFANKIIELRGFVYLGVDHMNISDKHCAGRGIELVIKSDPVFKQLDVHNFYLQMNRQGRKGFATITGLFQPDSSPLTPYVLNIQHVRDVDRAR